MHRPQYTMNTSIYRNKSKLVRFCKCLPLEYLLKQNQGDHDFEDEVYKACQIDKAVEGKLFKPKLLNIDGSINALNIATG